MSAPKRIGLNLLWLVPGVVGGSEEYTTRLLHTVADDPPDDLAFTLFVNTRFCDVHGDLAARYDTVVAPVSGAHKSLRVLAEATWLARRVRNHRIELMHHLGGILPAWSPTPDILTIHDLQPLSMPEHFSYVKQRFSAAVIPRSARAARYVVTLTEFTKRDITDRLGVPPERIVVVPPGFDLPTGTHDAVETDRVRDRYGLGRRPFFLYPAITYPHKNHLMLVEAFARLHELEPEAMLVLTGGRAQMEEQIGGRVRRLGLGDAVRRTGRIPAADLDGLYRASVALTFPSLSEGFGLPVLEAMSRDCPVIAAAATALPEVVDGAGVLVAPDDPDAWSEAMATLLGDEAERTELVRAGRVRARHYTWSASAAVLADVYRRGPA